MEGHALSLTRTPFTAVIIGIWMMILLSLSFDAWAQTGPSPSPPDTVRPAGPERFRNFVLDAAGPVVLIETLGWAGISQSSDTPTAWGRGAQGFGKRYASLMGQSVIQESVAYGLSEALAVLECRVTDRFTAGDHDLFIAQVLAGRVLGDGQPMVHIRKNGLHY